MNPIVPVVIIGGVAYELTRKDGPVLPPGGAGYVQPNYGSTTGQIVSGTAGQSGYSWSDFLANGGQAKFGDVPLDPDIQQKADLLQAAAKKAYDGMDYAGRSAAAASLNETLDLPPGQRLNGSDTWQTIASVAGGAAASAGCAAVGLAAAAPLCAIAGSYLGVKMEDWIAQPIGDAYNWVAANIGDAAGEIGDAIGGAAADVVNTVGGWIDDIF